MDLKHIDVSAEVKAAEDGAGIIDGYGSTFGGKPDAYGDIIVEGAFSDTLKNGGAQGLGVALLWQHSTNMPAGVWTELVENKKGLKVRGQLALSTSTGNDAYEFTKMGAVRGLSIGFSIVEQEDDDKRGVRYIKKADLWEISLVTFPANNRATITNVKSLVEEAKDKRQLEEALVKFGLSNNAAKYICGLVDPGRFPKDAQEDSGIKEILENLRDTRQKMNDMISDKEETNV